MASDVKEDLAVIRALLNENATEEGRVASRKFVPSSERVYGVRLPILNGIATQFKKRGFGIVKELWSCGAFEERLIAAKILGAIGRMDTDTALTLIREFVPDIRDWAVCDTLATQGVRSIVKSKRDELMALSQELTGSPKFWQRRFGIVLLTNYVKDKNARPEIFRIVDRLRTDREHYVRKAVDWLLRDLGKTSP